MSLRDDFETTGYTLFRYRSFFALAALPMLVASLMSFTYLGTSHLLTELWGTLCLLVSLAGLALRAYTVGHAPSGTSGRNTRRQLAQTLNTTGIYSVVRHPLYLGNYFMILGVVMFFHNGWIVLLTTCVFAIYYERVMFAEEAFLRGKFGGDFDQWAARTPAIVPRPRLWTPSRSRFSWRTVLRREYTGLFVVTSAFFLLEVGGDSVAEGSWRFDWPWVALGIAGTVIYLGLRSLKKFTRLLHDPARTPAGMAS